jgi:ABC-type polysaccharide/polyol phosphate transport system ATPase subunit
MSSPNPVIQSQHLWKLFRQQRQRTFKEMLPALLTGGKKNVVRTFWALQDINLSIPHGQVFGVIGPNGSGKSTLLKLIAGVTTPTRGSIAVHGRLTPLIELGAGFHPEMTGRENIFLNSAILGLTKKETFPLVDRIIAFSDISDFVDQPVKHYSSGMYLRLAFSIAVHVPFDILLVDEILSVGDLAFQKKCFALMEKFKADGKTIIYVGHDLRRVATFCDQAAYLRQGQIITTGSATKVVARYQAEQI